jgi:hypothetical protein
MCGCGLMLENGVAGSVFRQTDVRGVTKLTLCKRTIRRNARRDIGKVNWIDKIAIRSHPAVAGKVVRSSCC